MARDIAALVEHVRKSPTLSHLSPVYRQVLVTRLELEPTDAEIERARRALGA